MAQVILSSKYKEQGYVDLISFQISSGETIIFTTTEETEAFQVNFLTPLQISDCIEDKKTSDTVSKVHEAKFKFIANTLPVVCYYEVIRTDIAEISEKGTAKMTVKAIVTRNGWKPNP